MAITKIASARNATKTLAYVTRSHRCLVQGGQYIDVATAIDDFQMHIQAHRKQKNIHTYNVKVSFSKEDLSPNNPEDLATCARFAETYTLQAFPNRLVHWGIHKDGKGGHLHIHFTVSNVNLDGKCARDTDMSWTRLAPITDSVCHTLDLPVLLADEQGLNYVKDYVERRHIKQQLGDALSPAEETMIRQGRADLSYKEYIREAIADVLLPEDIDSLEMFCDRLVEHGVNVRHGKRDFEYIVEWKGTKKSITARKLGSDYGRDAILHELRRTQSTQTEEPTKTTAVTTTEHPSNSQPTVQSIGHVAASIHALHRTLREREEEHERQQPEYQRNATHNEREQSPVIKRDSTYAEEKRTIESNLGGSYTDDRVKPSETTRHDGPSL